MNMTLMYNGKQFAPVSTSRSVIVPYDSEVIWSVVGKFGRQALWMGSVEGQRIFTQLLVCLKLKLPQQCPAEAKLVLSAV